MIPKFLEKLFGKNWRTTLLGWLGAIFTTIEPYIQNGAFDWHKDWKNIVVSIGIVLFCSNTKDKQVTGSSIK